jgi:hypothetical protein
MSRELRRGAKILGDVLRKVPITGAAEIKVPSDIRRVLLANVDNLRENALDIFAKEISKVLSKVDVQHIVDNVLNNYTLRLEAKIDLIPKSRRTKSAKKGKK